MDKAVIEQDEKEAKTLEKKIVKAEKAIKEEEEEVEKGNKGS